MDVLQQRGVDEEQPEHPEEDDEHPEAGGAQARRGEQAGVEQRLLDPELDGDPDREQDGGRDERPDDQRAAPACFGALDDPDEQRDRGEREEGGAGGIERALVPWAAGCDARDPERAGEPDGHDRGEQPAPRPDGEHGSAADVADQAAEPRHGGPDGQRTRSTLGRDGVHEHGQRVRQHARGADARDDAAHEDQPDVACHRGRRGPDGEQAQPREQHALATSAVAESPGRDDQAREQDDVGVDDPQQLGRGRVERARRESGHCEVHGRDEPDHEDRARADAGQHGALACRARERRALDGWADPAAGSCDDSTHGCGPLRPGRACLVSSHGVQKPTLAGNETRCPGRLQG